MPSLLDEPNPGSERLQEEFFVKHSIGVIAATVSCESILLERVFPYFEDNKAKDCTGRRASDRMVE